MARLTAQQRELMGELHRRAEMERGAQTVEDFRGFETTSQWNGRKYPISADAARGTLERLVKRGLVTHVAERPRTYALTPEGLDAIGA